MLLYQQCLQVTAGLDHVPQETCVLCCLVEWHMGGVDKAIFTETCIFGLHRFIWR